MSIESATVVSNNPDPVWADHRAIFDRVFVGVGLAATPTAGAPGGGYADRMAWPGGQNYGVTSAITGYVRVPPEAESSFEDGNPTNFFHAGLMGLTLNDTNNQATVGVFGMSRAGKAQARPFGANFIVSNFRESNGVKDANGNRIPGVHCQSVGVEIDCGWSQPTGSPLGGSNTLGLWIPAEFYGGRPDGDCAAIKIGLYSDGPNDSRWKHFLLADHGGADMFAQIGMQKGPKVAGPSESQGFLLISSRDGQAPGGGAADTNQYKFSRIFQSPDGDIVFKPNSGFGSIIIGNESLTQQSSMHPTEGVKAPKGSFGELNVPGGNATISGTVTSGSLATGNISASSFNATGNGGFGGNVTIGGGFTSAFAATGNMTVNGTIYLNGYPVLATSNGGKVPDNHRTLFIQPN